MESFDEKGNERHHLCEIHGPTAVSSNQDGEHSICEGLASELDNSPETQRGGGSDTRQNNFSLHPKPSEDPPRLNFQIPRKNKEKRALFQYVPINSRECADILKTITSNYKDAASAGTFVYTKPRMVHSEPLERDFVEKRRELKQDGRTEKELSESFCFLLSDSFKTQQFCEKGLSVGHSWMSMLGNPRKGVYLCKYSDLIQIGPFDVGDTGEMIIFKVIKGKVKSVYENMSKSMDPTPKFDSHLSKNASRVTSLQSGRAYELTQQYFYEYCDYEISSRPRHVCPHAVVSFQYKGKETVSVPKPLPPLRSTSLPSGTGKNSYTVWRGQLMNRGREVYQICFRSLGQPFLPFKLPEKMEIGTLMRLDQVKLRIPQALFSWDLYSGSHEVFKRGHYCSLFEVVEKRKTGDSLVVLLQKLEEERSVLVNSVADKGFLFLLSSNQMANPNECRGGWKSNCLHALFVFQESRDVSKFSSKPPATVEPLCLGLEKPALPAMDTFIPALHYALNKVRCNPPADLSAGVERLASNYLNSQREGKLLQCIRLDYDHKLDEREKLFPAPRQKYNWEGYLRSYFYSPGMFMVPVGRAKDMVGTLQCAVEQSTVSEPAVMHAKQPGVQAHEDPEKLNELLKLIQQNKQKDRAKVQEGKEEGWDAQGLKRTLEGETQSADAKRPRRPSLDNGDHKEEILPQSSLAEVINSVGLQDTDLRKDKSQLSLTLVKMLDTLSKATQGPSSDEGRGPAEVAESGDSPKGTLQDSVMRLGLPAHCDVDLRGRLADNEQEEKSDDLEVDVLKNTTVVAVEEKAFEQFKMLQRRSERSRSRRSKMQSGKDETAGSLSSLEAFSPCSDTNGQRRGIELLGERSIPWVLIPITGLKSERYSERQENPEDPRCPQPLATSTHSTPEEKEIASPDPVDSSFVEAETEEPEEDREDQNTSLTDNLKSAHCHDQRTVLNDVDSIVDEQLSDFSSEMTNLLRGQRVHYTPLCSTHPHRQPPQSSMAPFSEYVSHFNTSLPVQSYVSTLHDSLSAVIDSERIKHPSTAHIPSDLEPSRPPQAVHTDDPIASSFTSLSSVKATLCLVSKSPLSTSVPQPINPCCSPPKRQPDQHSPQGPIQQPLQKEHRTEEFRQAEPVMVNQDRQEGRVFESHHDGPPLRSDASPPEAASGPLVVDGESVAKTALSDDTDVDSTPASLSSVIDQLQPEVLSNLVEIIKGVQKNTVHFYMHSLDEEESDVCWEIKEYLQRLGNAECHPLTFLEKENSQDKLLIIMQNVDIASIVHKIPALVSLKRLPSVSFAGVDSLDDIKNHTYNELFVSGGFIVSDEFVLNPDFITKERLQTFLHFLEELSTPESLWRWKVHCKTHKNLKQQSRVKSNALNLLNVLTTYQKRHIVEFLPYHECDAPSNQAPDLDCLVKLQAQYIQHRHVIFLTERRFEMFPHYSSNGILIANIDDIMHSMGSLIGVHDNTAKPPVTHKHPSPNTSMLRKEEISLDSEDSLVRKTLIPQESISVGKEHPPATPHDPYPPALDQLAPDTASMTSALLDFDALKSAISEFKASKAARMQLRSDSGGDSPRAFNVNPHQSFLSQGTLPASYSTTLESSNQSIDPASPFRQLASQEELRPVHTVETTTLKVATTETQPGLGNAEMPAADNGTMLYATKDGVSVTSADGPQADNVASTIVSAVPGAMVSPGTNYLAESSSNTCNNSPENVVSPKDNVIGLSNSQLSQPDLENRLVMEQVVSAASRNAHENQVTSEEARSISNQAGLLPLPADIYGVENPMAPVDRMMLQSGGLWPLQQSSMGMNRQRLGVHNAAVGLRPLLGSMGNNLAMVGPSSLNRFLPNSNMPFAWSGLAQGGASSIWGMGIGQIHQGQFIQSYAWRGNSPSQGNGCPPHRRGFNGW